MNAEKNRVAALNRLLFWCTKEPKSLAKDFMRELSGPEREVLGWFEAARSGDAKKLQDMLEEGFWAEARSPLDGLTALMIAAQEGRLECVRVVGAESNLDERDAWGNTAALLAAASGRVEALEMLIALGCSQEARNLAGVGLADAKARYKEKQKSKLGFNAESFGLP